MVDRYEQREKREKLEVLSAIIIGHAGTASRAIEIAEEISALLLRKYPDSSEVTDATDQS